MKRVLIIVFCLYCTNLLGQSTFTKKYNAELDLKVDNDAFYLINEEDQYYSSGIFAAYRKMYGPETRLFKFFNRNEKISRINHAYHFFHLMYTPWDIKYSDVRILDRPYAGAFGLGKSITFFTTNNWVVDTKVDFGILGPATKTAELQIWWHDKFDMKVPRGWEHQINNTPYINLTSQISKSFFIDHWLDVVYESDIEVGTIFNNIQQGGIVRVGQPKTLANSGYRHGLLGVEKNPEEIDPIEWYFFWGISREFVIYNSTIQGNFIGEDSPYTESSEQWVTRRKTGIVLHWQTVDFGLIFNYNTNETTKSNDHRFIRIRLAKRI